MSERTLPALPAAQRRVTVIRAPRRLELVDLGELWAYRELLGALTARLVRVRYKQTLLGATWAVIQPVLQMLVFSLVFGRVAKLPSEGVPYPIFVYSGLLAWQFFANASTRAVSSMTGNAHLITKVYFPRLILPLAAVLAALVDFAIASLVMIGLMIYYQVGVTANLLAVPVLSLGIMLAASGIGAGLGALNVSFRDLQHAMPFAMQIGLFLTPVVYPPDALPGALGWLLKLNPMTGLVDGFRAAFLGRPFDLEGLLLSFALSAAIFACGVLYFHHVERKFADLI